MKLTTRIYLVSSLSERSYTFTSPACLRGVGRDDFTFLPVIGYQQSTLRYVWKATCGEAPSNSDGDIETLLVCFRFGFSSCGCCRFDNDGLFVKLETNRIFRCVAAERKRVLIRGNNSSPRLSVKETLVMMGFPRNKWTGIVQSV